MKILDLFCGAGGAAMGLHRVFPGAEIIGVDYKPQPRYPFRFIQDNAMAFPLKGYDFMWASPPCQRFSVASRITSVDGNYPDLIDLIRLRLREHDVPWVIENVPNSPLDQPFTLCGSMFGLGVWRHRRFEHRGFTVEVPDCQHWKVPYPIDVTGTGGPCNSRKTPGGGLHRKPKNMAEAKQAMGIDWMIRKELVEAIPPAYSEWIAHQWLRTRASGC